MVGSRALRDSGTDVALERVTIDIMGSRLGVYARVWSCVVVTACGHHAIASDPDGDATSQEDSDGQPINIGPCWPIASSIARGSVDIGTGDGAFVSMPDEINLVYGIQGGFHIPARARIHGLEPGDASNILDPSNPRSRFEAFFVDTGQPNAPLSCPVRYGYVADGPDSYTEPSLIEIRFDTALGPADLFDKQFRVQIEVLDATGGYATADKVVIARAPIGWTGI